MEEKRYAIHRGLFYALCVVFMACAIYFSYNPKPDRLYGPPPTAVRPAPTPQPSPAPQTRRHVAPTTPKPKAETNDPPPAEPARQLKIIPFTPIGGSPSNYDFVLKQCFRDTEEIKCWGLATNTTDERRSLTLNDSNAVDDEGNSTFVAYSAGDLNFQGSGSQASLIPGTPTKFIIRIRDAHMAVNNISLDLVIWADEYGYKHLIFREVPVQ